MQTGILLLAHPLQVTLVVGIGTSSPSVELSIAGSDPQLVLWEGSDGASSSKVQLGTGLVQGFINIHKGDGTRTVQISSDDTSYFNGGNVGIGTTGADNVVIGATPSSGNGEGSIFLSCIGTGTKGNIIARETISFQTTSSSTPVASGTERARIDSSGRLLVGTSSTNGSFNSAIQIAGSGLAGTQLISRFDNNAGAPNLYFAKSRGASVGTNTLVQSGDEVGNIGFYAADGTNYVPAAQIRADIDGTPGTNDMPGRLVFSTTADGRVLRRNG
jgi:hypothetical protein